MQLTNPRTLHLPPPGGCVIFHALLRTVTQFCGTDEKRETV